MKSIKNIFYGCMLLLSCDPGGAISITDLNGNALMFVCGEVKLSASTTGGFIFNIGQKFAPVDTITIYPDSLMILYKNKSIPFELWNEKNRITSNKVTVVNEKTLNIDFTIDGGTTKGDTLLVLTKGYIYCDNVPTTQDTIKILIDKGF